MTIEDIVEKRLLHRQDVQNAGARVEEARNALNRDIAISRDSIATVRNTNAEDYATFKSLTAQASQLRNQYQFIMKAEWIISTRKIVEAYYDGLNIADADGDYFKELDFALTMKDRRTPEDAQAAFGMSKEEWDKQVRTNPVRFRSDIRRLVEQRVNILSDRILDAQTLKDGDRIRMRRRYEGDVDSFFRKIIEDAFRDLDAIFPNTKSPELQRIFDMKTMFMNIARDILSIGELYATGWDTELLLSRGEEATYKGVYNKRLTEQAELRKVLMQKQAEEAKLKDLEGANAALEERNRILDIQIKQKKESSSALNTLLHSDMFKPPDQQPEPSTTGGDGSTGTNSTVDVARDMADIGMDDEEEGGDEV